MVEIYHRLAIFRLSVLVKIYHKLVIFRLSVGKMSGGTQNYLAGLTFFTELELKIRLFLANLDTSGVANFNQRRFSDVGGIDGFCYS